MTWQMNSSAWLQIIFSGKNSTPVAPGLQELGAGWSCFTSSDWRGGVMPGEAAASEVFNAIGGGPATWKGPSGSLDLLRDDGVVAERST